MTPWHTAPYKATMVQEPHIAARTTADRGTQTMETADAATQTDELVVTEAKEPQHDTGLAETAAVTVQKWEQAQNHSEEVEEQDGRAASAHSDHPCKKPEAQNSPDQRHGDSKVEAQCLETEQDEHRDRKVELAKQVRAKKNAKKRGNSKVEPAEQVKAQEDAKKHIPTCKTGTYLENEHGGFKVKANQRCAEDEHGDGGKEAAEKDAKKHILAFETYNDVHEMVLRELLLHEYQIGPLNEDSEALKEALFVARELSSPELWMKRARQLQSTRSR